MACTVCIAQEDLSDSSVGLGDVGRVRFRVKTLVRRACMASAAAALLWAWALHSRAETARRAREAAHDGYGDFACTPWGFSLACRLQRDGAWVALFGSCDIIKKVLEGRFVFVFNTILLAQIEGDNQLHNYEVCSWCATLIRCGMNGDDDNHAAAYGHKAHQRSPHLFRP